MTSIENEYFKLNINEDDSQIINLLLQKLTSATAAARDFFDEEDHKQIEVNIYDSKEKFLDYAVKDDMTYEEYGEGAFSKDRVDVLFRDKLTKENLYSLVNRITHQYSHVLYASIYDGKFERPLWLDEGLAQMLSKERITLLKDSNKCKSAFLSRILNRHKEIPAIEYLKREGSSYKTIGSTKYSGYLMCYFMVRYLASAKINALEARLPFESSTEDTKNESIRRDNGNILIPRYNLRHLIRDKDDIEEVEKHIISRTINYFSSRLGVKMSAASYRAIKTPQDLMDYMDANLVYGWRDIKGCTHKYTRLGMDKKYRVNSIDDVFLKSVGTCIEQTKFAAKTLRDLGFPVSIFSTLNKNSKGTSMHAFAVYSKDGKYYYFEHTAEERKGIYSFDSLDDLIEYYKQFMEEGTELYEMYDLPDGLKLDEVVEYISKQDLVIGRKNDSEYALN